MFIEFINPRLRACAARVILQAVCVCVCLLLGKKEER